MSNNAKVLHEYTAQAWHRNNMVLIWCKEKKQKHAAYDQASDLLTYLIKTVSTPPTVYCYTSELNNV